MDEMLFRVFAEAVGRYLDAVDRLAATQHAAQTGPELRRMAAAWRALLHAHQPTGPRARCGGCGYRHFGRAGPRRGAMCSVWRVATAYFTRRTPGGTLPGEEASTTS